MQKICSLCEVTSAPDFIPSRLLIDAMSIAALEKVQLEKIFCEVDDDAEALRSISFRFGGLIFSPPKGTYKTNPMMCF
jgi:hypothetical protein